MKYRLFVAFGLGMLAGVLLWPDGDNSPDPAQQHVEPAKVATTGVMRQPVEPRHSYHLPRREVNPESRGAMQGFRGESAFDFPPAYAQRGYPDAPDHFGYRFRPLDADSDSRSAGRYTGNYSSPPHPSNADGRPRWNEVPAYVQPQPQWRTSPGFDGRQRHVEVPPGHLYSAR